ncbi:MAG TPA: hypothetical protein VFE60_14415 [Roseiarcus sp.]|jgi:hypothetical protein|nr:hypothetical protein [Roseiarcus sp.]
MRVRSLWSGAALAAILIAGSAFAASREDNLNDPIIGEENAVLADAPNVPPPSGVGSTGTVLGAVLTLARLNAPAKVARTHGRTAVAA